jgi:hypothetical protein
MPRPDWTDFNRSDPGITLVELFAFLGESLVYHRRKFAVAALFVAAVVWLRRSDDD